MSIVVMTSLNYFPSLRCWTMNERSYHFCIIVWVVTLTFFLNSIPITDSFTLSTAKRHHRSSITFAHSVPSQHEITNNNIVTVKPVNSQTDVISLADLRYEEWIATSSPTDNQPSLRAFRMATSEIMQERYEEGAIAFLASVSPKGEQPTTMNSAVGGAAELSPVEFDQCLSNHNYNFLYVTDVVTAQKYRRMGIGNALMDSVEEEASAQQRGEDETTAVAPATKATWILLHVKHDNVAAIEFYKKRGYMELPSHIYNEINHDQFEENTGTNGEQLLLGKEVPMLQSTATSKRKVGGLKKTEGTSSITSSRTSGGSGFGGGGMMKSNKKAKKKKRMK